MGLWRNNMVIKTRPDWMTEAAEAKAQKSYLLPGETVLSRFRDMAKYAASYYPPVMQAGLEEKFYGLLEDGILAPSTPVWANFGRDSGLPISCFGNSPSDDLFSIFEAQTENAMLSKNGGGTSMYYGNLRSRGADFSGGGKSSGTVSWLELAKERVAKVSQGGIRRGAEAGYVEFYSTDLEEVLNWKRHNEDYHLGINVRDADIEDLKNGNATAIKKWQLLLKTRMETGEPYLFFPDKANKLSPFKDEIVASNLCSEIAIPSNDLETFVCCLSSLNALHYDKWLARDAVRLGTYFLMGVMQSFIKRVKGKKGFKKSLKCAVNHRPLGLGVLGYHSYLQSQLIPFESLQASYINDAMFKLLQQESHLASEELVSYFGRAKGQKRASTVTMAIAPNTNSAFLCGEVSRGIEPFMANLTVQTQDKKTLVRRNLQLEEFLISKNLNTPEIWQKITEAQGSVLGLTELTDEEKAVFKTAYEIDQTTLLRHANQRARYIDQSQSLNLFLTSEHTPQEVHDLHKYALSSPFIKGLYYCRSKKMSKVEPACEACSS